MHTRVTTGHGPPRREPAMADRVHVLRAGRITMPKRWVRVGGADEPVTIPVLAFLVVAGDRLVLVDSGCTPVVTEDPVKAWGKLTSLYHPHIGPDDLIDAQIRRPASRSATSPTSYSRICTSTTPAGCGCSSTAPGCGCSGPSTAGAAAPTRTARAATSRTSTTCPGSTCSCSTVTRRSPTGCSACSPPGTPPGTSRCSCGCPHSWRAWSATRPTTARCSTGARCRRSPGTSAATCRR